MSTEGAREVAILGLTATGVAAFLQLIVPVAALVFVSLLAITAGAAAVTFATDRLSHWFLKRTSTRELQGEREQFLFWIPLYASSPIIIYLTFLAWQTYRPQSVVVLIGFNTFAAIGVLFVAVFVFVPRLVERRRRQEHARMAARTADRLRIAGLERSLAMSELKTLQAQIEPHFLYNVLANVQSMVAHAPDEAQDMLDHLIGYLKLALPNMRSASSTLTVELDLVRAYLGIAALRFGERLQVTVSSSIAEENIIVPPMLLLPLVENAVKHGAEPKRGPVAIVVSAHCDESSLLLTVTDSGAGFAADAGSGIGLANVRERLQALFQGRAELNVEPRFVGDKKEGVIATLKLPKMLGS